MIVRKQDYDKTTISALCVVSDGIWLAFTGSSDYTLLRKVSKDDINEIKYDISCFVSNIPKITYDGTYIYSVFDDSIYLGAYFNSNTPLNTNGYFTKPSGILEVPVDVISNTTLVGFITPGTASGTNCKAYYFTVGTNTYGGCLDMPDINNIISITVDDNNYFWAITNESSPKLVRIAPTFESYTSWYIENLF